VSVADAWDVPPDDETSIAALDRQLAATDQTLARVELVVRRRELYLRTRGTHWGFVADTARACGMSAKTVQRLLRIARSITPSLRHELQHRPTPPSQRELIELAGLAPEDQAQAAAGPAAPAGDGGYGLVLAAPDAPVRSLRPLLAPDAVVFVACAGGQVVGTMRLLRQLGATAVEALGIECHAWCFAPGAVVADAGLLVVGRRGSPPGPVLPLAPPLRGPTPTAVAREWAELCYPSLRRLDATGGPVEGDWAVLA